MTVLVESSGALAGRRAHHLRLRRQLQRRVPRHPAPRRGVDQRRAGARGPPRVHAGRLHRARLLLAAGNLRGHERGRRDPDRLALLRHERAADVRALVPAQGRHGCLRRRGRRQHQALGRRVGAAAREADRDGDRARPHHARLGPPGVGAGRRHDRRRAGALPRARRPARHVRRGSRALSARVPAEPRRRGRPRGKRARADRRGGGRRRKRLRARPGADRQGGRPSPPHAAVARSARPGPGARVRLLRVPALRARARPRVRPRVRAGAAHRPGARARALARRAADACRLERVHGDPLRPDPARALQIRGRNDRAQRLGRAAPRGDRRPRALAGQGARR